MFSAVSGARVILLDMPHRNTTTRLWLIFDGPSGDAKVLAAAQKAPKRGRRVEVTVPQSVIQSRTMWLLSRKQPSDVVLAVAADSESLEARKTALGKAAEQYEIVSVPVVERSPQDEK